MIPPALLGRVLTREGGVADVQDGKGTTRWGQTPQWLEDWALPVPTTAAEAAANYQVWASLTHLDTLCAVDDPLAEQLLDFAVHSGVATAVRSLQRILKIPADGVIGPQTRLVAAAHPSDHLALSLYCYRLRLIGKLLARAENARYAGGWLNRMAELAQTPHPIF